MGHEGDRVHARFARGCRCFAVDQGDSVVAFGWLSTGPEWVGELSTEIKPGPGEAYVWNCFTLAGHRRRGHYRRLLQGMVALLRAEGVRRLWIGSVEDPAEKADADAGFRPVIHLACNSYGPLRMLRAESAPGAPPDLVAEAMSRLGLRRRTVVGLRRTRVH
jgi:GNAT superfamily N-acetyltransferase